MNKQNFQEYLTRYWAIPTAIVWGAVLFFSQVIALDPYGIDEQAARGLLLNWSVSDNIINPIVTLGAPDFRALLFIPVGIYWPGNMLAAKLFSASIALIAMLLMYKWTAKHTNQEAALIALALFAISPTLVQQIDSFGAGIFLLICFVFGNWLDHAYRSKPRMFGGWYFTQMIMIAVAITLHPIALAYPLALAYMWWKKPDPTKNSLHVYIGILLSVVVAMAIKAGWDNIHWLQNPVIGLADAIQGHVLMSTADVNWAFGVIFLALLAAVVIVDNKFIFSDLLGFILLLAIVIGFLVGDSSWALLCLALVLFRGIPLLIQLNSSLGKTGLLGQRGVVIGLVFLLATTFMIQDKAQSIDHRLQMISPEDQLIATLASVASDDNLPFRAASEWPGRTMLAAKRDVLGLPPRFEDQSQYREALKGLTHVLFNPYEEKNKTLSEFLSQNGDVAETLLLEPMGVIMAIREHNVRITERRVQQAGQEESEQNTAKHKPAHANELDTQ